ncbi:PEPxxWA-CTERM sorting domain-containing protein [Massilia sp. METH4]|uniref:PEPxxWA-CTERM sorting domain-containing protein n=1 Tax=Massilia sp. METH4 TaxID=3123041 RepID=UPI0030D2E309
MHKFLRAALGTCLLGGAQAALADVTVAGSYVKFGVNDSGSLIDFGTRTGIQFDPTGSGNFSASFDMLMPGNPFAFNTIGVNGNYDTAGAGSRYNAFGSTTGILAAGTGTVEIASSGSYQGLAIRQLISFDLSSSVIHTSVLLTNISGQVLDDVSYAVGLDADPDYRYGYSHDSVNTILGQGKGASVRSSGTDLAVTLRNTGNRDATASVSNFETNPYVLSGDTEARGNGDFTIALGYAFGTLAPWEQRAIGFDYVLTPTAPVPEPTNWAMLLAGLGLLGAAARRRG